MTWPPEFERRIVLLLLRMADAFALSSRRAGGRVRIRRRYVRAGWRAIVRDLLPNLLAIAFTCVAWLLMSRCASTAERWPSVTHLASSTPGYETSPAYAGSALARITST